MYFFQSLADIEDILPPNASVERISADSLEDGSDIITAPAGNFMEKAIVKRGPPKYPTLPTVPKMQKFQLSEGMAKSQAISRATGGIPKASSPHGLQQPPSRFFIASEAKPTRPARPPKQAVTGHSYYKIHNSKGSVRRNDWQAKQSPWQALVRTTPLKGLLKSIF